MNWSSPWAWQENPSLAGNQLILMGAEDKGQTSPTGHNLEQGQKNPVLEDIPDPKPVSYNLGIKAVEESLKRKLNVSQTEGRVDAIEFQIQSHIY